MREDPLFGCIRCLRDRTIRAKGLCNSCYNTLKRLPNAKLRQFAPKSPDKIGPKREVLYYEDVEEDIRFLADGGAGATEVAARVGYKSPYALRRALYRHGEKELASKLNLRDIS